MKKSSLYLFLAISFTLIGIAGIYDNYQLSNLRILAQIAWLLIGGFYLFKFLSIRKDENG